MSDRVGSLEALAEALAGDGERMDAPERAAVAIACRAGADDRELLFIRRARHDDDPWSGQMAFPGGRVDPGDDGPRAAAVRETLEEVAVDLEASGRPLGRLDDLQAVGRGRPLPMVITPFVYGLTDPVDPEPGYEVAEVVWIPLEDLADPAHRGRRTYDYGKTRVQLPCIRWRGKVIWGLTFRMLDDFLGRLWEAGAL